MRRKIPWSYLTDMWNTELLSVYLLGIILQSSFRKQISIVTQCFLRCIDPWSCRFSVISWQLSLRELKINPTLTQNISIEAHSVFTKPTFEIDVWIIPFLLKCLTLVFLLWVQSNSMIPKSIKISKIWWLSFWYLLLSRSVMSNSLRPHGLQHVRLPCPSSTPGACSNSCPLIRWCHPTISSSVVPFCSCPQSFPASRSFPISQLFASGGQSIGVSASASALPMIIQDWFPLGWTSWISLQSKGLSRIFSNTTVWKH